MVEGIILKYNFIYRVGQYDQEERICWKPGQVQSRSRIVASCSTDVISNNAVLGRDLTKNKTSVNPRRRGKHVHIQKNGQRGEVNLRVGTGSRKLEIERGKLQILAVNDTPTSTTWSVTYDLQFCTTMLDPNNRDQVSQE